jgi:type IV secretion system protein VirB5
MKLFGSKPPSPPAPERTIGAHSGGPQNPYLDGRREWLERYGSYISRAKHWRMMAFGLAVITTISITGNVYQIHQQKIIPWIIQVDALGKTATPTPAATTKLPPAMIQSAIAQCIVNWRTVTADMDLQKKMTSSLAHFVAGTARGLLDEWYTANQPYKIASSGKLVQIEVKRLPLPVSKDSWRLEWTETTRNHSGALLEQQNYEATVTIKIDPPTSDDAILRNPGGIFIIDLSVAKQLAVPSSGQDRGGQ